MNEHANRRILLVDDTEAIHVDFKKILTASSPSPSSDDARAAFFGTAGSGGRADESVYEVESAHQGPEALELVTRAVESGRPFALAFVDVRMPPGWDGVQTIERLWKVDPDLQVVICSAYADYSWAEMVERLGRTDRLLFLKKPFDPVEVSQFACALTEKWSGMLRERERMAETRRAEQEARAYAASLKTVNRALETSKAQAEASDRAKSEFLARMSLEIREPMEGIVERAERLREPELPREEHDRSVDAIRADGGRLLGVLDGVHDLAALDTGSLVLDAGSCSPSAIVEEVAARHRGAAEAKGIALSVRTEGPLPSAIRSDGARLGWMVSVLVEGAIERTDAGAVEVALAMEPTAPEEDPRLRVEVVDTGSSIPPGERGRLFEAFAPGDPGSGVHLALARRLALRLGGDLTAESDPRGGSRFRLLVAALDPDREEARAEPPAPLPSRGSRPAPDAADAARPGSGRQVRR